MLKRGEDTVQLIGQVIQNYRIKESRSFKIIKIYPKEKTTNRGRKIFKISKKKEGKVIGYLLPIKFR